MQHRIQSFISKENAGKTSVGVLPGIRSSAGCERVQALAGEQRAKMLGESDRERKVHTTSSTALAGKQSGKKHFKGL